MLKVAIFNLCLEQQIHCDLNTGEMPQSRKLHGHNGLSLEVETLRPTQAALAPVATEVTISRRL
jgi:hypothetical protein